MNSRSGRLGQERMEKNRSEHLTTLAVGGPAAGQSLAGSYGAAMFYIRQPLYFNYSAEPVPDEVLVTDRAYYREMALWFYHPDGTRDALRFWAHADSIKDEFDLMRELASGYRPVHQDNRHPRPSTSSEAKPNGSPP
jgi:hypothetical protein